MPIVVMVLSSMVILAAYIFPITNQQHNRASTLGC